MPKDNEVSNSIKQGDYGRVIETQEAYGANMRVGAVDGCVVIDVGDKRVILPPKTALATAQAILKLCGFEAEFNNPTPFTLLKP